MDFDDLKAAPREVILRFASELEKEFDLSDVHAMAKEMFPRLQELNEGNRCYLCKAPAEGHFFEECVARKWGRIDHLYRLRTPG